MRKLKLFSCFILFIACTSCSKNESSNVEKAVEEPISTNHKGEDAVKNSKNSNLSDDMRKSIKEYENLLSDLESSKLIFRKNKITTINSEFSITEKDRDDLKWANAAYDYIKGKVEIPRGAKVLVRDNVDTKIVIFDAKLPPNTLGGEYSAKVTIDRDSGKVLEFLAY